MSSFLKDIAKFAVFTLIGVIGLNCVTVKIQVNTPEDTYVEVRHVMSYKSLPVKVEHTVGYSSAQLHLDHSGYVR
jgi:hypothetical protein